MNKIIPFKKDIIFKTRVSDITSISLEHKVEIKNESIFLEFVISGDYKMTEASINKENFSYTLPFELDIDSKYDMNEVKVDIDDFYYEIINNEILRVNIAILLDNLKVKEEEENIIDEVSEDDDEERTILDLDDEELPEIEEQDEIVVEEIVKEDRIDMNNKEIDNVIIDNKQEIIEEVKEESNEVDNTIMDSIFSNINSEETFKTYHVYIMREEDTIEKIISTYNVSKEQLEEYNNLSNVKIGDKIIIPNVN